MVRELGFDPEDLTREHIEDRDLAEQHGLRFDSDVHFGAAQPVPPQDMGDDETTEKDDDDVRS